ncbi:MAG: alpha/beta hydrolase [Flavobacteriales bacterium]
MQYIIKSLLLFIFLFFLSCKDKKSPSIKIPSTNNLVLEADYYQSEQKQAPLILLFHQAGFSRGEYLEIAPKLNSLGFDCIAVDQRSGKNVNGIGNNTFAKAKKLGLKTDYISAYPDLEATLRYAKKIHPKRKIIVWGSSYSASLVFILTSKHLNLIDGIVSFSPGQYFNFENQLVSSFCKNINQPVFITSSKNEAPEWKEFKQNLSNTNSVFFLPNQKGKHGSKALWENNSNHEEYWRALERFLNHFIESK